MPPPDHESALLAAVLLAQRAQAGEDVSEAAERLAELAGQPSEFAEWDESKHARDRGRFAHTAGAGGIIGTLKAIGAQAGHAEHLASAWAKDRCEAAVSKLPPRLQKVVRGAWAWTKAGVGVLFTNFTVMQALAERTARKRGLSEEEARRLRGVLSAIDNKTFEVFKVGALAGLHAAHLPAYVSATVPVASTAYLAYSTAEDPLATVRAARELAREAAAAGLAKVPTVGARAAAKQLSKPAAAQRRASVQPGLEELVGRFGEWEEGEHPRSHGKFARKGTGESGGAGSELPDDPAAGRPSSREERHTTETGEAVKPAPLPFRTPPPKKGRKGEGMPARPTGDASQTKIGDLGETLATRLGFRSILPPGQRSHRPGEVAEKGSTIDLEYDHSGRGYELKLCNTTATEYRLKAKASEKEAKMEYARQNDLTAHVLVGVRDVDTGEVHFYAGREPGLIGAEVSEKAYDYVGTVRLEDL